MGLRQWIARQVVKAADIAGWDVPSWQSGQRYYPTTNYGQLVKKYQSWTYACTKVNAASVAQVPLRLYAKAPPAGKKTYFKTVPVSRSDREHLGKLSYLRLTKDVDVVEIPEHPFLDLMTTVNEFMNGFELMENLSSFLDLTGNAYWVILKGTLGQPVEIWPLMSQKIKIIPDKKRFISHYEYGYGDDKEIIQPEDMIHFKLFNPSDAFFGLGPLEAASIAADLSINMNLYEANLFQNRATPDYAIVYPPEAGEPSADEIKRIKRQHKKEYGGLSKTGVMGFLFGGAKIEPISLSPKEMSFLQGRKWSREELCNCYGVPVSKFTSDNVNRANAEAGDYSYMKDTIAPRLRKVEQKLNAELLPLFDPRLFVAFDSPVPSDKDFRLKEITSHLTTGYSAINHERQEDNQEPVPWGDVPLLPMNRAPLGTQPVAEAPVLPEPKKTKAPRSVPPLNHPTNFINEGFVSAMRVYFTDIGEDILRSFDADADVLTDKSVTKANPDDFVSGWWNADKWNKRLGITIDPYIEYTTTTGAERAMRSVGSDKEFDYGNPEVMRSLEVHRSGAIQSVNGTTVKRLRVALAAGIGEGEGVFDLRKRVDGVFEDLAKYQSEVIARTETIWAWNEGAVRGYQQSGMVETKQWLAASGGRTCEFCMDMDGKTVGIADNYFDKGTEMESELGNTLGFEYDDVGHPPLHPQCRCCIVPVLVEI